MYKIIDRTLTALESNKNDLDEKNLLTMCELLIKLGVDYIELSVPLLKKMKNLPEGGHYLLLVDHIEEIKQYAGFEKYVIKAKQPEQLSQGLEQNMIYEFNFQDIRQLMTMADSFFFKPVRITGLDYLLSGEYNKKIEEFISLVKKKVDFCPGDKQYCATALAVEWLMKGGRSVSVSFNGIGGYAKLEEVLMGTKVIMHKKIKQDLSILPELSQIYEKLTGRPICYNKAVVGKNIFNIEAGIQLEKGEKNPVSYEPYDPQMVGRVRRIVIGKNSGCGAIKLKLLEKGIKVPEKRIEPLLEQVRDKSMGWGRSLTDREFLGLVREVLRDEA